MCFLTCAIVLARFSFACRFRDRDTFSLLSLGDGRHAVAARLAGALLGGGCATALAALLAALLFLLDHADEISAHVEALALHLEDLSFAGRVAGRRGEDETERGRRGTTGAGHTAAVVALGATAGGLIVEEEVVVGKVGAGAGLVRGVFVGRAQR